MIKNIKYNQDVILIKNIKGGMEVEISIIAEIARVGAKRRELAEKVNMTYPTFCRKLSKNGFSFSEGQAILSCLGYEIKLCKKICT